MRSSFLLSSFLTALAASTATASPVDVDANASSPAAVMQKRANSVHVAFFTDNNYGGKTQDFYTVRDSKCCSYPLSNKHLFYLYVQDWPCSCLRKGDIAPEFADKISSIRFPTDGSGSCRFYQWVLKLCCARGLLQLGWHIVVNISDTRTAWVWAWLLILEIISTKWEFITMTYGRLSGVFKQLCRWYVEAETFGVEVFEAVPLQWW